MGNTNTIFGKGDASECKTNFMANLETLKFYMLVMDIIVIPVGYSFLSIIPWIGISLGESFVNFQTSA